MNVTEGGAIMTFGPTTIRNSTFSGNNGSNGGAMSIAIAILNEF
jgi:hypothetical protein